MSSESRSDAEPDVEREKEREPEPGPEPEAASEPEAESVPEPDSEPGSESDSGRSSETGSEPDSGTAPAPEPEAPAYADRSYRSPGAFVGGVLLLLLGLWLGGDALMGGTGRIRLFAVAGLVFTVPLVIAYTLRPAVYASEKRMLVRNPFRTVTIPWGSVESVQSGYSSEVIADGTKYQLWSIPVSLRARNRAARQTEKAERGDTRSSGLGRPAGLFGPGGAPDDVDEGTVKRAPSDQAIDELRKLAIDHSESPAAQGKVTVRWAYAIVGPALVGALVLAVLIATG